MRTGRFIAVCSLALFGVIGIIAYGLRSHEPAYQGKKLSQWLLELDFGRWPRNGSFVAADEAIRQMSTNAFPAIEQLLHARSSALKTKVVALVNRRGLHDLSITTDRQRYNRAIAACFALGDVAEPLIPAMAGALNHMDPGSQAFATQWLATRGTEAEIAVPALIEMLLDTNTPTRCFAAQTLAHVCGSRRDVVVPVLEACLRDTNQSMRLECQNALQILRVLAPEPDKRLRQNAEAGSAEAQLQIAEFLYVAEPRISSNYVQAYKWATIAASQSNETAKLLVREIEVLLAPRDVDDGRAAAQEYLERHKRTRR